MYENDVSAKALGEWLDASDRTVRDLAEKGIAVRTKRGRYDLKQSVINHMRHLREVSAGRGGEKQILDLTAERARLAKEQADHQEMRNAQMRGDLLHVDDVVRNWQDIIRKATSAVLAVPDRIAQRHTITPELREALDREIRDTLNDLADDEEGAPPGTRQLQAADEIEAQPVG